MGESWEQMEREIIAGEYTQEPFAPDGVLQNYKIVKVLGIGGFGITYLAEDKTLKNLVAIKEYFPGDYAVRKGLNVQPKSPSHAAHFDWGKGRFLMEAQILAQFKHPNIIKVLTLFEKYNTAYMVMDFEYGKSLAEVFRKKKTLDEAQVSMVILPLLSGLELLHESGFIHRDIKPENILVRKDNSPVLIDFGSARNAMTSRSRSLTALLTPGYAPLEQYYSTNDDQGPWTDIYALGGVLYRAISGQRPPEAPLRTSSVLSKDDDPMPSAIEMGKGKYSEHFLKAVDWALCVLERARPQTIREWRGALFPSLEGVLAPAPPREEEGQDQEVDEEQAADETKFNLLFIGDEPRAAPPAEAAFPVEPIGYTNVLVVSGLRKHARGDSSALKRCATLKVKQCYAGREALRLMRKEKYDLVICDSELKDMKGLAFLQKLGVGFKTLRVVMVSTETRKDYVLDVITAGVSGYVFRPYSSDVFRRHLLQLQEIVQFYEEQENCLATAFTHIHAGEFQKAIEPLREAMGILEDPTEFYDAGCNSMVRNQYGRAIIEFRKASKVQTIVGESLKGLAEVYGSLGMARESKDYYVKATEAFTRFNRLEENKRLFMDVVKTQNHVPNPFNTLGVSLRRQGDYAGAINSYRKAIVLAPDDENVYYNLARVLASDLEHQEALENVKRALEINPNFRQAAKLFKLITGGNWYKKKGAKRVVAPPYGGRVSMVDD